MFKFTGGHYQYIREGGGERSGVTLGKVGRLKHWFCEKCCQKYKILTKMDSKFDGFFL